MICTVIATLLIAAQPVEVEDSEEAFEEIVAVDLQKDVTDEEEMDELVFEEGLSSFDLIEPVE